MDAGTGLALLGSAKLVEKLLGPTFEYLGGELKTWTEKRVNNVGNIFSNATIKLGDKIEIEGAVPPRVLKGILYEGSFCDDTLTAEYFGGVLASSRSGISRDDRGAYFIALISRLSTYQIRMHYVFYHMVKRLFNGIKPNIYCSDNFDSVCGHFRISIPLDVYLAAMEFDKQEQKKINVLMEHTLIGLHKEKLLYKQLTRDNGEYCLFPSQFGIELFFWAYGKPDLATRDFFDPANQFEISKEVNINTGI